MEKYKFRIDVSRIKPLLQRDLYRDPDTMLRELAQNAIDAIRLRAKLDPEFNAEQDGRITFRQDPVGQSLIVSDNGAGLSKTTLLEVFRYYGRSDKVQEDVGGFGIGAKSIFAASDSFTIHTKTKLTEGYETSFVYATLEGLTFEDAPEERGECGTTITIPVKENPRSKALLNKIKLNEFCECVKIPICMVDQNGKEEKISQRLPWGKCVTLQLDGLEAHLKLDSNEKGRGWTRIYTDGLFVCEQYNPDLVGVSINVLRKGMIDLTMSRDTLVENDRFKEVARKIQSLIGAKLHDALSADMLSDENFPVVRWCMDHDNSVAKDSLTAGERDIIKQLHSSAHCYADVFDELPFYKRSMSKSIQMEKRTMQIIDLIAKKKKGHPVYYNLTRRLSEIQRGVRERKNLSVVYLAGTEIPKEALIQWMRKGGISEIAVERRPKRRKLFSQYETLAVSSLDDLKGLIDKSLIIFPKDANPSDVKQAAGELGCYTIKLRDSEQVKAKDVIDLRDNNLRLTATLAGKEVKNPSSVRQAHVAPSKFAKLSKTTQRNLIFPHDLQSECLLRFVHGLRAATSNELVGAIKDALPNEAKHILRSLKLNDCEYDRILKLITTLDWENEYSPVVLKLAIDHGANVFALLETVKSVQKAERKIRT